MNTPAPLISVIIPVYNRPWELHRALEALTRQTFSNFEVIVCDDGSKDDVQSVVAQFQQQLQLTFTRIDNSGGPARPRNVCVGLARAPWISFLDSDDWWDAGRMAAVAAALGDDVDLLYHPLRLVKEGGGVARRGRHTVVGFPVRGAALRHFALRGNPIPNSAAVVRRKLLIDIGGISESPELVAYEDFDTWLRLVEAGARLKFLPATWGSYWLGSDAISAFSAKQIGRQIMLFQRHEPHFGEFQAAAQSCQDYTLALMYFSLEGPSERAREHLLRASSLPTLALRLRRALRLFRWRRPRLGTS